jgi:hypothetical protein
MLSRYEAMRQRREQEQRERDNDLEWRKRLDTIKAHFATQILTKNEHPEAWEYVERLFPSLAPTIEQTKVYKNDNTAFCAKIGLPKEAGGLFFTKLGIILICWTRKFKDDVVIVHEMLHYVSALLGSRFTHRGLEEDFAYLKSVRYLLSKGYDMKFVCEEYMLPHYESLELSKLCNGVKPTSAVRAQAKTAAVKRCYEMVANELTSEETVDILEPPEAEEDRFDFM